VRVIAAPTSTTRLRTVAASSPRIAPGFATTGGDQRVVDLGDQHVRGVAGFQPQPQVLDLPVRLVSGDPCKRFAAKARANIAMAWRGFVSNPAPSGIPARRRRAGSAIQGAFLQEAGVVHEQHAIRLAGPTPSP
jgi:hypothetical protein